MLLRDPAPLSPDEPTYASEEMADYYESRRPVKQAQMGAFDLAPEALRQMVAAIGYPQTAMHYFRQGLTPEQAEADLAKRGLMTLEMTGKMA